MTIFRLSVILILICSFVFSMAYETYNNIEKSNSIKVQTNVKE